MFPCTPWLFGNAGTSYKRPPGRFQSVHIQKWGEKPETIVLSLCRNTSPFLKQPSVLKLFQLFFLPTTLHVSFQSIAVSNMFVPLGGVMYVNEPDNVRDTRLKYLSSFSRALLLWTGGAALPSVIDRTVLLSHYLLSHVIL